MQIRFFPFAIDLTVIPSGNMGSRSEVGRTLVDCWSTSVPFLAPALTLPTRAHQVRPARAERARAARRAQRLGRAVQAALRRRLLPRRVRAQLLGASLVRARV